MRCPAVSISTHTHTRTHAHARTHAHTHTRTHTRTVRHIDYDCCSAIISAAVAMSGIHSLVCNLLADSVLAVGEGS